MDAHTEDRLNWLEARARYLEQENWALRQKLNGRSRDLYDIAHSRGRRVLDLESELAHMRSALVKTEGRA